jgi:hypothetical protein
MQPGDGTRNKEQSILRQSNESVTFGKGRKGEKKRGIVKNVKK